MKNVKKILAFVLATIMALSCLAGMMPVFAAEDEGTAEVPTPTYSLDFTKYTDSMQEAFYFNSGAGSFYIDETGSNGYLTVGLNGATGAAHFKIGNGTFQKGSDVVVDVPANQMGYFVIKYKTTQSHVAALRVNTVNKDQTDPSSGSYANGSVDWNSYPTWIWNGLDEWSVQVVDASDIWGNVGDNEYISDFLFRLAEDGQPTKAAPIQIAYINFFATKEDAEAFANSEATKTIEVEAGTADLNAGYSIGGKRFFTTSENPLIEMTAAEIETVGTWGSYGNSTTAVMADAIFLGTGESVDATDKLPIENANPSYASANEGETKLGNGGYPDSVGGMIKVTSEHKYLRFWGWTGNPNPAVAFGYELAGEQFFDENFLIVDEGLQAAVPDHPNARRACITIPLDGLEKGKLYTVQLLVKHEDGSISTMSSRFHNFKIATEIEYDYQDAEGNLYAFDGVRMNGKDGTVLRAAKFDDGKMYATDGYFYALTEYIPGIQKVATTYEVLEGVEHTAGNMVISDNRSWANWLIDGMGALDWTDLGGLLFTELSGSLGADSGIEAVGYQLGANDEVWPEGALAADGTYNVIPDVSVLPKGEYQLQLLVKKDGATYMMPGTRIYQIRRQGKFDATHYEWDAFKLRISTAPDIPVPPLGVSVNPIVYEAAGIEENGMSVTIPTGERNYTWVTIKGMKGKVLSIDKSEGAEFLMIYDKADNTYEIRKTPSTKGLALPILEDEYTVKIKTQNTIGGEDQTYTFVENSDLLSPDGLAGAGTAENPYVMTESGNYYFMVEGPVTFTYTATYYGQVSIFVRSVLGTLTATSSADEDLDEKGVMLVHAGDTVTAVVTPNKGANYVYGRIGFIAEEVHEHTLETIPGVTATCQKTGTTDKVVCTVCEEVIQDHEETPIASHNYQDVVKKEATCTAAGAKDVVCTYCEDVKEADVEIPATGHTPGDWETVTEAAVGVEGKKVKKCTVCGAVVEEEAIAALEAPATTAPATGATTEAPATTAPATDAPATTVQEGGCGSIIGASAAALVLAAAAAAVALKKKED